MIVAVASAALLALSACNAPQGDDDDDRSEQQGDNDDDDD
jgi:hypothetical protein